MGLTVFNDFYDEVKWESQDGQKDVTGEFIYKAPVNIKCRHVGGSHVYKINDTDTIKISSDEYQIEPDTEVKVGDKLNGHIILDVQPSRDIFGRHIEFWIARVE